MHQAHSNVRAACEESLRWSQARRNAPARWRDRLAVAVVLGGILGAVGLLGLVAYGLVELAS